MLQLRENKASLPLKTSLLYLPIPTLLEYPRIHVYRKDNKIPRTFDDNNNTLYNGQQPEQQSQREL